MADPLLDMAIQAGYFPAPEAPVAPPQDERVDYQTFLASQGAGPGVTMPSQVPTPVASGPVDSPSELAVAAAPTAPQAQPSTTVKEGVRFGTSSRGYSEGQMGKVSKADAGLQGQYAAADAKAAAGGQLEADILGPAANAERAASQSVAEATVDRIYAQGHAANLQRALADSFAQDEMKINMEAQAVSDQAKADYVAALADMRATKINPAQLWSNLTPGMRFGTLVTAFVHDFLGAKGIKTSAMDTLNMAIDRNINAQVQALKTKGDVAEGFKSLWWMQRNQAASDAEARTRVRGFLLEGVKQQVISNMAQYEAGLATAQGQAAIAAIDKELANNLISIHRHIDANALALRNQALELHKAKLQAAIQSQSISLQREQLQMQKDQMAAKAAAEYRGRLVPDITASGGGRARWIMRENVPDTDKSAVLKRMGALGSFADKATRFQELFREEGGKLSQQWWKRPMTERERQLVQLRDDMAYELAYADSGMALNAQEIQTKKDQFLISDSFMRGGSEQQIAQGIENNYKRTFAKMAPFVHELKEGDLGYNAVISPAIAANAGVSEGQIGVPETLEANKTARKGAVETGPREVATQALGRPDKFNPAAPDTLKKMGVGESAQDDWESFKVRNPEAFQKESVAYDATGNVQDRSVEPYGTEKVPAGAAALTALRFQAEKGDGAALQQLNSIAFPENEGLVKFNRDEAMLMNFARMQLMLYADHKTATK